MPAILILGSEDDPHVTDVCECLRNRNAQYAIADFQEFPLSSLASLDYNQPRVECTFAGKSKLQIRMDEVGAVWYRRLFPPALDPAVEDETAKLFALKEARAFLGGLWAILAKRPWLNPYHSNHRAELKTRQLDLAKAVGLANPSVDRDERHRESAGVFPGYSRPDYLQTTHLVRDRGGVQRRYFEAIEVHIHDDCRRIRAGPLRAPDSLDAVPVSTVHPEGSRAQNHGGWRSVLCRCHPFAKKRQVED
jgi:hypothetical protein